MQLWFAKLLRPSRSATERRTRQVIASAFDAEFYRRTYPDTAGGRLDPLTHFIRFGWRENRNPSAHFDTPFYRSTNSDLGETNPLEHFVLVGEKEGRRPRPSQKYLYTHELENGEGVTPARRPDNAEDFAIAIPFETVPPASEIDSVALIIHVFYPELVPELLGFCRSVPCRADLFFSTDTETKASEIREHCRGYTQGSFDVRVTPNRAATSLRC